MGVNSNWAPEKARVIYSGVMETAWYDERLRFATGGLMQQAAYCGERIFVRRAACDG